MNIYDIIMLPLEKKILKDIRREIIPKAYGNVLEIGYGTGANFPFYNIDEVSRFSALDLHAGHISRQNRGLSVEFFEGCAESLPFSDNLFDTVVETLVFCSVEDLESSIGEVFRVLKPGGTFIFIDHVLPPNKRLAHLFKAINKVWPKIAGGCNLTREPHLIIDGKGFQMKKSGGSGFDIFRWGVAQKTV